MAGRSIRLYVRTKKRYEPAYFESELWHIDVIDFAGCTVGDIKRKCHSETAAKVDDLFYLNQSLADDRSVAHYNFPNEAILETTSNPLWAAMMHIKMVEIEREREANPDNFQIQRWTHKSFAKKTTLLSVLFNAKKHDNVQPPNFPTYDDLVQYLERLGRKGANINPNYSGRDFQRWFADYLQLDVDQADPVRSFQTRHALRLGLAPVQGQSAERKQKKKNNNSGGQGKGKHVVRKVTATVTRPRPAQQERICEDCEQNVAEIYCGGCVGEGGTPGVVLCLDCTMTLHRGALRSNHDCQDISQAPKLPSTPHRYVPHPYRAPFAILLAMTRALKENQHKLSLDEEEIKQRAQPLTDTDLHDKPVGKMMGGFDCIENTLIPKKLVQKEASGRHTFALTQAGRGLGEQLDIFDDIMHKFLSDSAVPCLPHNFRSHIGKRQVVLVVDARERDAQRLTSLAKTAGVTVLIRNLQVADYVWVVSPELPDLRVPYDGSQPDKETMLPVLVERKSWHDLHDSMRLGRWAGQLSRMTVCGVRLKMILVEGCLTDLRQVSQDRRDFLQKEVERVCVEEGFAVGRTYTWAKSAAWLLWITRLLSHAYTHGQFEGDTFPYSELSGRLARGERERKAGHVVRPLTPVGTSSVWSPEHVVTAIYRESGGQQTMEDIVQQDLLSHDGRRLLILEGLDLYNKTRQALLLAALRQSVSLDTFNRTTVAGTIQNMLLGELKSLVHYDVIAFWILSLQIKHGVYVLRTETGEDSQKLQQWFSQETQVMPKPVSIVDEREEDKGGGETERKKRKERKTVAKKEHEMKPASTTIGERELKSLAEGDFATDAQSEERMLQEALSLSLISSLTNEDNENEVDYDDSDTKRLPVVDSESCKPLTADCDASCGSPLGLSHNDPIFIDSQGWDDGPDNHSVLEDEELARRLQTLEREDCVSYQDEDLAKRLQLLQRENSHGYRDKELARQLQTKTEGVQDKEMSRDFQTVGGMEDDGHHHKIAQALQAGGSLVGLKDVLFGQWSVDKVKPQDGVKSPLSLALQDEALTRLLSEEQAIPPQSVTRPDITLVNSMPAGRSSSLQSVSQGEVVSRELSLASGGAGSPGCQDKAFMPAGSLQSQVEQDEAVARQLQAEETLNTPSLLDTAVRQDRDSGSVQCGQCQFDLVHNNDDAGRISGHSAVSIIDPTSLVTGIDSQVIDSQVPGSQSILDPGPVNRTTHHSPAHSTPAKPFPAKHILPTNSTSPPGTQTLPSKAETPCRKRSAHIHTLLGSGNWVVSGKKSRTQVESDEELARRLQQELDSGVADPAHCVSPTGNSQEIGDIVDDASLNGLFSQNISSANRGLSSHSQSSETSPTPGINRDHLLALHLQNELMDSSMSTSTPHEKNPEKQSCDLVKKDEALARKLQDEEQLSLKSFPSAVVDSKIFEMNKKREEPGFTVTKHLQDVPQMDCSYIEEDERLARSLQIFPQMDYSYIKEDEPLTPNSQDISKMDCSYIEEDELLARKLQEEEGGVLKSQPVPCSLRSDRTPQRTSQTGNMGDTAGLPDIVLVGTDTATFRSRANHRGVTTDSQGDTRGKALSQVVEDEVLARRLQDEEAKTGPLPVGWQSDIKHTGNTITDKRSATFARPKRSLEQNATNSNTTTDIDILEDCKLPDIVRRRTACGMAKDSTIHCVNECGTAKYNTAHGISNVNDDKAITNKENAKCGVNVRDVTKYNTAHGFTNINPTHDINKNSNYGLAACDTAKTNKIHGVANIKPDLNKENTKYDTLQGAGNVDVIKIDWDSDGEDGTEREKGVNHMTLADHAVSDVKQFAGCGDSTTVTPVTPVSTIASNVKCGSCGERGHNRRFERCPNYYTESEKKRRDTMEEAQRRRIEERAREAEERQREEQTALHRLAETREALQRNKEQMMQQIATATQECASQFESQLRDIDRLVAAKQRKVRGQQQKKRTP